MEIFDLNARSVVLGGRSKPWLCFWKGEGRRGKIKYHSGFLRLASEERL
jgi:hypothetical protein